MGPIDYLGMFPQRDFLKDFQNGMQLGAGIRQMQQQRDMQEAYKADIAQYLQAPTAQAAASLALKYPGQGEAIKRNWDTLSEADRASQGSAVSQVYAATINGRPDVAAGILQKRIEARKNSGLDVGPEETIFSLLQSDPQRASGAIGLILANINDPKTFATQFATLGGEQRNADKAPAELAKVRAEVGNLNSQVSERASQAAERAARLGLDRDKLMTETQLKVREMEWQFGALPPDVAKNLNDSATQAISSAQLADQSLKLASQLDTPGVGFGSISTASEWLKKTTGNQDAVTALRQEYSRIRSQGVIKSLPPGVASDRDIALAMEGFPVPTADSKTLASFLRGMAKLQQYDATLNDAKARWFGEVRNLGPAKRDIEIDGVKVPAGTNFLDFSKQFVGKKADQASAASVVDGLAKKYGPQSGVTGGY